MSARRLLLLSQRRFAPLFVTQFLGALTNNLFKTSMLVLIVFRIFPGDAATSASYAMIAGGVFALPHFLFAAMAGQLADRLDKSLLARVIKGADVLIMAFAAFALIWESLALLMLALFATGVRGTFFGPIKYAILPNHLERRELLLGTGMIQAGGVLAALTGQIGGGLLAPGTVAAILLLLPSIGFAAACLIPAAPSDQPDVKIERNVVAGIVHVVGRAVRQSALAAAILGISWFYALGAVFTSQFAPLVRNTLGAEQQVVSLFLTAFSLGIASGALLVHRLLKGEISARHAPVAATVIALFSVDLWLVARGFARSPELTSAAAFALQPVAWRIWLDLFVVAAAASIFVVPLYAIIQTASSAGERARNIAANNIVNSAVVLVATILITLLLRAGLSTADLFLLLGACTLMIAIAAARFLVRSPAGGEPSAPVGG